jgi:S1-C subfamily serine protease
MGRTGWIIAAVAGVLIVGSIVALMLLSGEAEYRTMTGPVAIVQGPVPRHGLLGVGFGSMKDGPATVESVMPGSGAAEAGLQAGDVIVAVGDVNDPDAAAVKRLTEQTMPGDVLTLRIRRGDELRELSVRLISFEEFVSLDVAGRGPRPPAAAPIPATAPSPAP